MQTVSYYRKQSKELLKGSWGSAIGASLIMYLILSIVSCTVIGTPFIMPFYLALMCLFLELVRGKKVDFVKDVWSLGGKKYVPFLVMSVIIFFIQLAIWTVAYCVYLIILFLSSLATALSGGLGILLTLLACIPIIIGLIIYFILLYKWMLPQYISLDDSKLNGWQALKLSSKMVKGNFWKLVWLHMSINLLPAVLYLVMVFVLLLLSFSVIAMFVTIPMLIIVSLAYVALMIVYYQPRTYAAIALFYEDLRAESPYALEKEEDVVDLKEEPKVLAEVEAAIEVEEK
jgi:uncharacterized membrane protein